MEVMLCRLQSILLSMEKISTLSGILKRDIETKLVELCTHLRTVNVCEEGMSGTVLRLLDEIDKLLYIPLVDHLISRLSIKEGENVFDEHNDYLGELHDVNERKDMSVNAKPELCRPKNCKKVQFGTDREEKSVGGMNNVYWERRRDRIRDVLGKTSLRFDKAYLKRKKFPFFPRTFGSCRDIERQGENLRDSQFLSSLKSDKCCQDLVDTFWGIVEDYKDNGKRWRRGDTICVLNSRSELRKLREFLKEKRSVRSFYIQRKPSGVAGCKGTWLTPPYRPPLEIKYDLPSQ